MSGVSPDSVGQLDATNKVADAEAKTYRQKGNRKPERQYQVNACRVALRFPKNAYERTNGHAVSQGKSCAAGFEVVVSLAPSLINRPANNTPSKLYFPVALIGRL